MRRQALSKNTSAKKFRSSTKRTKSINISQGPMRGGWRL